jgi:hypothetical protein
LKFFKAAEAEEARRLAEEKAIQAIKLEEELIEAQRRLQESQINLQTITAKNISSMLASNGSSSSSSSISNGNQNSNNNNYQQHAQSAASITNHHLAADDNENDEDDDGKKENVVELKLNESLPPEQYREPAVDKNQKMKMKLEVNNFF